LNKELLSQALEQAHSHYGESIPDRIAQAYARAASLCHELLVPFLSGSSIFLLPFPAKEIESLKRYWWYKQAEKRKEGKVPS
jgi:hypothetical protein